MKPKGKDKKWELLLEVLDDIVCCQSVYSLQLEEKLIDLLKEVKHEI